MPVNLTFAGKHGQDPELLKYAYAFEAHTSRRFAPPVTPQLQSDRIETSDRPEVTSASSTMGFRFRSVSAKKTAPHTVHVEGEFGNSRLSGVTIEMFVDGHRLPDSAVLISNHQWSADAEFQPFQPPKPLYGGVGQVVGNVNIVVLAKSGNQVIAKLLQVPQNAAIE